MSDVYVIVQDDVEDGACSPDTEVTVVLSLEGPAGPAGAAGAPGAQDIGWTVTGTFAAGETLNFGPLQHAAAYAMIMVHSDSGVAAPQMLTVNQVRLGGLIATATIALTTGAHDWEAAIVAPFAVTPRDIVQLVMPSPADSQLVDLSLSLGSTP